MKRIISAILAVAMAVTMLVIPANAAKSTVKVWNGKVSTSWYTGDKTEYNISSPGQLAGLAELVNSGESMQGVVINLTADLKMNNTKNWKGWYTNPPKNKFTPIGQSGNPVKGYYPFAGIFNGNGHSISGLYVNNYRLAGLFGLIYCGCVSNLIIKESVIIGYDDGETELVNDGVYAGAIVGISDGGVINKCENDGYVYAVGPADIFSGDRTAYAGGIAGSLETEVATQAAIAGAFAAFGTFYNAAIFTDGNGGLIKDSCVANCVNYGRVVSKCANSAYSGGVVGWGNNGIIKNCLSLIVPSAKGGYNSNSHSAMIAGGLYNCDMVNCYHWQGDKKLKAVATDVKSSVVKVKREAYYCKEDEIKSKELVKRLGSAFKYAKNDRPYLTCDLRIANKSK